MEAQERIPAVSIVVPAYRVTEYIAETLDSIYRQTFSDYEVIVVNDGCPDTAALEQVLARYEGRFVYRKKPNGGLSSARNAGLEMASAPLIALLDSDDVWEPRFLEETVGVLNRDASITAVFTGAFYFGNPEVEGKPLSDPNDNPEPFTFERVADDTCNPSYCCVMRTEAVRRAGGYDDSLRSCEDFDLHLRMLKGGAKIARHPGLLFRYRRRAGSLSASAISMRNWAIRVADKMASRNDLSNSERDAVLRGRRKFEAELALAEGREALAKGDIAEARRHFALRQRLAPYPKMAAVLWALKICPAGVRAFVRWRGL
ncbi:MAG TPA: glycosyltransferase family A protein [Bryobacteraceae bacterium]|jgi:glycosyltransferase involved in cell wall biosynthesis|nr:glycosyltransferase family A protein [Bryobacteraceae bacterium]